MKYLVALLFVGAANAFYQPEDLPCCCVGGADPNIVTFDGASLVVEHEEKGLKHVISRWNLDTFNPCKYSLRAVSKKDIDGIPTDLHFDWIGFGAALHPKNHKPVNGINFLMAQDVDGNAVIATRGSLGGGNPPTIIDNNYLWEREGCKWQFTEVDSHRIELRSDCCQYALNWLPNGVNSAFEFYVGTPFQNNGMEGICSDCNGNLEDDWRLCPDGAVKVGINIANLIPISKSCEDGDNTGTYFDGGRRLV